MPASCSRIASRKAESGWRDFDDGKDAGALRTIGEVSAALGIKPHVLRYWEEQFPHARAAQARGRAPPVPRLEDVALIERIDSLVNREGYTLKGAKGAIAAAARNRIAQVKDESPSPDVLARLKAIRATLADALSEAA